MKRFSIVFLLILSLTFSAAAAIEWLATEYNYGTIHEENGTVTGIVSFVNRGNEEVMINAVRPSCGCTDVDYPKDVIQPGDTAKISIVYDPRGGMGRFEKNVRVYVGDKNELTTIKIRGKVICNSLYMENKYPVATQSGLRLDKEIIELGDIVSGGTKVGFIHGYNPTTDSISIKCISHSDAVTISTSDDIVPPGDSITMSIYYQSSIAAEIGNLCYNIDMITNNDSQTTSPIVVTANIKLPADNKSDFNASPWLSIGNQKIDFGKIKRGQRLKKSIEIANEGSNNLQISRVFASEPAAKCSVCPIERFKTKKVPAKLKPSEKCSFEIEFDTTNITTLSGGAFHLIIHIKSNDPRNNDIFETIHCVGIIENE